MSAEPTPERRRAWPRLIVGLFAVIGLLGVAAVIVLVGVTLSLRDGYQPAEVAGETPETTYTLRDANVLEGTRFVRINIAQGSGPDGSSSYSGGGREDRRNILLLDRTSGVVRRLLPDNSRRIAAAYFLPAATGFTAGPDSDFVPNREQARAEPPAYFAILVDRPGQEDRADLLVGSLDGGGQRYVMQGLDGIDTVWMHSPTRIGFVVRERLNLYYRIVDVPSLRVVMSRRIAI